MHKGLVVICTCQLLLKTLWCVQTVLLARLSFQKLVFHVLHVWNCAPGAGTFYNNRDAVMSGRRVSVAVHASRERDDVFLADLGSLVAIQISCALCFLQLHVSSTSGSSPLFDSAFMRNCQSPHCEC